MDIAEIRKRKEAVTLDVPIILVASARAQLAAAEDRLAKAERDALLRADDRSAQTARDRALADLDNARTEAAEHTVVFRMRSISRPAMAALRLAHPPTKQQREDYRKAQVQAGIPGRERGELTYNPDTFPPAVVAACCAEPEMTYEEALEIWEDPEWNEAELAALFQAAMTVNMTARRVDLGEG